MEFKMTHILVIRHGESVANQEDKFAGISDFDLTERGKMQAELTAKYIKENFKVDAVYASDLLRAYNTALPTARAFGLEVNRAQAFREIHGGRWEAVTYEEIWKKDGDAFSLWSTDYRNAYCPEGETIKQVVARAQAETRRIAEAHDGETVVIASHATPVWAIRELAQENNKEYTNDKLAPNASVTILRYENGQFFEVRHSITDHLGELATFLTVLED